jgi:hypothetical protein
MKAKSENLWKSFDSKNILKLGALLALPSDRTALKHFVRSESRKGLVAAQDSAGLKFGRR